jgi:hypothetical protein
MMINDLEWHGRHKSCIDRRLTWQQMGAFVDDGMRVPSPIL